MVVGVFHAGRITYHLTIHDSLLERSDLPLALEKPVVDVCLPCPTVVVALEMDLRSIQRLVYFGWLDNPDRFDICSGGNMEGLIVLS